jgi:hypothetical protein
MTLVIGWLCDDGILLAADDEAAVQTPGRFPQKRNGDVKIKRVGKNCAVAIYGNASKGWIAVSDLSDSFAEETSVEARDIAEQFRQVGDQRFKDEPDIGFVVGGFKSNAEGKRKVLYDVNHRSGQPFEIWEPTSNHLWEGVTHLCQALETYLPTGSIRTLEQAERIAAILILLTSEDVLGGVGELGSIAKITDHGCIVITDQAQLQQLRQVGRGFQRELMQIFASALSS